MKKVILFFLVLFYSQISAQWIVQNINTTSTLSSLEFLNNNTGWVLGQNISGSTFYKTTNGGNTWADMYFVNAPLLSKLFLESGMGLLNYFSTSPGTNLVKTYDAGLTFSSPTYLGFNFFYDFHFFNDSVGIGAGSIGAPQFAAICKTTDGGYTWSPVYYNINPHFNSCSFINNQTGFCGGIGVQEPYIIKTTDGGNSWNPFPSGEFQYITNIQFFDELTGWIQNEANLYLTVDGGLTWNLKAINVTRSYFNNWSTGWYVSADSIFYTTNGGNNWTIQYTNPGKILRDIFFINSVTGWASGDDGFLLHTINAGTPVELLSFTAEAFGKTVKLNWTTGTETNNKGFEIQRRTDASDWILIGFAEGEGNSTVQQIYSFSDISVNSGKYYYRLKQIDFDGTIDYSGTVEVVVNFPIEYTLQQNYPNPFNPGTTIKYSTPLAAEISLKIYNAMGEIVKEILSEYKSPGEYEIVINMEGFTSGVYFYKLSSGAFTETKKMILMR